MIAEGYLAVHVVGKRLEHSAWQPGGTENF